MPKGGILHIYVCCNIADVLLAGIDVNLIAWVAGELVVHVYLLL